MKIHEYQAKEILRRYGVATPRGKVADNPDEAARICEEFGGRCVVKAQIHAGGRGKGGGVKLAKSREEAREHASKILGMQLVTHAPEAGDESGSSVAQLGTLLVGFFAFAVASISPWVVYKLLPAAEAAAVAMTWSLARG